MSADHRRAATRESLSREDPPHGRGVGAGDPLSQVALNYAVGGISTVSIRYTVALAVCTPPHTTEASFTIR